MSHSRKNSGGDFSVELWGDFSVELWRISRRKSWRVLRPSPAEFREELRRISGEYLKELKRIPGENAEEFPEDFWRNFKINFGGFPEEI